MLKINLLFKKNRNFTGEQLENSYDQECEIFRVLSLYEFEYMRRFSNLHQCTFNHFAIADQSKIGAFQSTKSLGTTNLVCLSYQHFIQDCRLGGIVNNQVKIPQQKVGEKLLLHKKIFKNSRTAILTFIQLVQNSLISKNFSHFLQPTFS